MAFAEVIQIVFLTLGGCVLGIVLAAVSLLLKRSILGFAALLFNVSPFLFLIVQLLGRGV